MSLFCPLTRTTASALLLLTLSGASVVLIACGGDEAKPVNVSLREWSISVEPRQVQPGSIEFIATNEGAEPHEFVVIKTDLSPSSLPVVDGKVDEEKVEIVDEIEPFAAGSTEKKILELKAGSYVLICNIVERVPGQPVESHYELGMRTSFVVTPNP
jgi:uncharacterized cupredoxin-like copper-binding protein